MGRDEKQDKPPIGPPEVIAHAQLTRRLIGDRPEVTAAFDAYGRSLFHCEMGAFARLTDETGSWRG
jgi:hypothetical protein